MLQARLTIQANRSIETRVFFLIGVLQAKLTEGYSGYASWILNPVVQSEAKLTFRVIRVHRPGQQLAKSPCTVG